MAQWPYVGLIMSIRPVCSIAILHYRKAETPRESFEVGFTAAVRHIEATTPYRFTWVSPPAVVR
jgi:hypothetical protein